VNGTKEGVFPRFMGRVFEEAGARLELVEVSRASKDQFPLSSHSACWHEISLGRTDVCVGNFWPTAERNRMPRVSLSQELFLDSFHLVSRRDEALTFKSIMGTPFRPFAPALWYAFIGVTVVGALFMRAIDDSDVTAEDDADELDKMAGDGDGVPWQQDLGVAPAGAKAGQGGRKRREPTSVYAVPLWVKALDSYYVTVMSFVNSAMGFTPLSTPGRLFNFALGLFL